MDQVVALRPMRVALATMQAQLTPVVVPVPVLPITL
jgi:hypothetical protein